MLGWGGAFPFVALALAAWAAPTPLHLVAELALILYGAVILSFLGAVHWGWTLRGDDSPDARALIWGITPSLIAWIAGLLVMVDPPAYALGLLIIGFFGAWRADRRTAFPAWYLRLRKALTFTVILALAAGLAASVATYRGAHTTTADQPASSSPDISR